MDWIIGLQKAIDYIEENLTETIDYEMVAAQSFSSSYHFQRVFSILCGFTIGEYIRNRRLSLAGTELATSDAKVIDVGLLQIADILFDIETVELTIVQPRLDSISEWSISADELRKWGAEVFVPKAEEALSGRGEFHPGVDTCRFCKARFQCRARSEYFLAVAQHEFKEPDLLTDEEMAEILTKADALKKWVEEVYTFAQKEAIDNRKEWPGFKLVMGKSNRKYTNRIEQVLGSGLKMYLIW